MSDLGTCAPADLLERFVRGELDGKQEQEIREHVKQCGICGLIVERLPEALAVESEGEVPTMDEPLAGRVDEGFRNHLAQSGSAEAARERKPKRSAFPWLHPAFAYGLVLLLIYPAYVGVSSRFGGGGAEAKRETPAEQPALVPASIIDLNAERGPATTDRPAAQGPGTGAQVLTFFVGVNPALRYTASLADSTGAAVFDAGEIWSSDGEGTFYLVCPKRLLPGGAYKLRVAASDRPSGKVEKEYVFEFRAP
jgi:hypothetical protein